MKMRPRRSALNLSAVIDENHDDNSRFEDSKDLKPFMDATQLYRSIAGRLRSFPIFMYRNLIYMREPKNRTRRGSKKFDFDAFFKDRPRLQTKEQRYLTITYMGFYTSIVHPPGATIRMETLVSKNRCGRKRLKNKTSLRVSAGVCEVPVNPEPEDCRFMPIISIPPDMLNLDSSSKHYAKSLIIKSTVDNVYGETFECEQVLLNENGTCPLKDGDYELRGTRAPTIWVRALGMPTDFANMTLSRPMLCCRFSWTADAHSGWVSAKDTRANCLIKNDEFMQAPTRRGHRQRNHRGNIDGFRKVLKYSFQTRESHLVKSFVDAVYYWCPWCNLDCCSFFGLYKHLKLNHDRFDFNFDKDDGLVHVGIKMNDKADISYGGHPTREFFKKEGPRRLSPYTEIVVWKPRRVSINLDRLLERQGLPDPEPQSMVAGHNRMYYHSSTCLPTHPSEMDEDSENERDPKWLRKKTAMMIDDFTDVNEGEKEVIKMWNLHVLKNGYVGDCQRPKANKDFFSEHATTLIEKNLYRNGFLHLINQYHFNLLGAAHVARIYRPVRDALESNSAAMERFRQNYLTERSEWLASGGEGGSRDKAKVEFQTQSGPSTSSTFVTGDGTLRRKMTQQTNAKPVGNTKSNMINNEMERHATRKRKLSLESQENSVPARRLRGGSDPVEPRKPKTKMQEHEKPVMRKTAN